MRLLLMILTLSLIFSQEPCEGTCLSEEDTINLFNNIQECEFELEKSKEINENLNSQIYMYIHSDSLYQGQIEQYEKQIELQKAMIKEVKPKWYDNKYLWFGYGVLSMILPVWAVGQVK